MAPFEDELRQEMASIQEFLAQDVDDSFVRQIAELQMRRRLTDLEVALQRAADRTIELHFENAARRQYAALPTPVVTAILGRLQSTLTFGAWTLIAGPNVSGAPPASVERSTRTEVIATPPGSFRLVLRKEELELSSEFDLAMDTILDLTEGAVRDAFDEELSVKAQALGREGTRRLELFFRKLADEQLDTDVSWSTRTEHRESFLSHGVAKNLSDWLAQVVPSVETITVGGYLRRADTLSGSFKLEDEVTHRMYEGSGDPTVLAHAEMDARYTAQIEHESRTAAHTGRVVEKYTLVALTALGRD